jgi:hypothetical protein
VCCVRAGVSGRNCDASGEDEGENVFRTVAVGGLGGGGCGCGALTDVAVYGAAVPRPRSGPCQG